MGFQEIIYKGKKNLVEINKKSGKFHSFFQLLELATFEKL